MADRHDETAARAYRIWEESGCPDGLDREHWAKAEAELEAPTEETSAAPAEFEESAAAAGAPDTSVPGAGQAPDQSPPKSSGRRKA